MDYRNADGSLSEMCGNGIRVLRLLPRRRRGLVDPRDPMPIATRDGIKTLHLRRRPDHRRHGHPKVLGETEVTRRGPCWPAVHVDMGNPHAVAFVDDLADAGPLARASGARRGGLPRRGQRRVRRAARGAGTWRCACTSAARARPGPAAPAPCAVMVGRRRRPTAAPARRRRTTASTSRAARSTVDLDRGRPGPADRPGRARQPGGTTRL